jgi:4-amino-4-deoxy-L-arabinose transferase-like glycosyltransferase
MAKKIFYSIIFSILLCLFFSYRLLEVPMGITGDEDAMGYNAVLISQTAHDENGKFMPFFVLANNGTDWKQPVTQYYLAGLFKLFGSSIFLLRFSSIIITLISSFLLHKLSSSIFNKKTAILSVIIFLTTPLIMIQSHMGLDNIMPIPFAIIWIYGLDQYSKKNNLKLLIISAISLGISFYTYKGMRAVFPIWYALSLLYIYKIPFLKNFKPLIIFSLFSLPFLAITPYLNFLYPGSIFGGSRPSFDNIYNFLYPYFSSYDITFMFIKGDDLLYHSTGYHGFFLLASLPIFVLGIYKSIRTNKLSRFILVVFFISPILYGTVNSVHRASRLMCLIPFYSIICAYGFQQAMIISSHYKKIIFGLILILFSLNYLDFLHYYYYDYSLKTQALVGDLKYYLSFKSLKKYSDKYHLTPYISQDISHKFFEALYFKKIDYLNPEDIPPNKNSILLTNRQQIDGMTNLHLNLKYYQLLVTSPDITQ